MKARLVAWLVDNQKGIPNWRGLIAMTLGLIATFLVIGVCTAEGSFVYLSLRGHQLVIFATILVLVAMILLQCGGESKKT